MADQIILTAENSYEGLDKQLQKDGISHVFLVCGNSMKRLEIAGYFEQLEKRLGIRVTIFSSFAPNPQYESVVEGIKLFGEKSCDGIIAVGGGSAMDVAKCIKLYSGMDSEALYLEQAIIPNEVPLYAIPTTAGTGSEATKFAVIYYNEEKQSVTHESCIPSVVLFDERFLSGLPLYQKKATMLDALCHGIESFWSVNSTKESQEFSKAAIRGILSNWKTYLEGNAEAGKAMLLAAYEAGKAINLTQTTAGHAMCYKLTSLYGLAHGHGAALCVYRLWPYMLGHLELCVDPRGRAYLEAMFLELAKAFGADNAAGGFLQFEKLLFALELETPVCHGAQDYELLKSSVNPVRLKNHPITMSSEAFDMLYHKIVEEKK